MQAGFHLSPLFSGGSRRDALHAVCFADVPGARVIAIVAAIAAASSLKTAACRRY
jgi:hypothetical protein